MITFCVFAGSRIGTNPQHMEAAIELGRQIGAQGHAMVYGGGTNGLRGACAKAAHEAGAKVTAVFPPHYHIDRIEQFEFAAKRETGRAYRLNEMQSMSEAFLFLAGGDTVRHELSSVLGSYRRSEHHKPIILVNAGGCWDQWLADRAQAMADGLIPPDEKQFVRPVASPAEVFAVLRERTPDEMLGKKRNRVVFAAL